MEWVAWVVVGFGKSSFSKSVIAESENQECNGHGGCKTCKIISLPKKVTLWKNDPTRKVTLKLDIRCNFITENCIYLFVCKLCKENDGFYVGQTTNTCRDRANGHRGDFNYKDFKKSALSHHVYEEHPDHIMNKLKNYKLGIIKEKNWLKMKFQVADTLSIFSKNYVLGHLGTM